MAAAAAATAPILLLRAPSIYPPHDDDDGGDGKGKGKGKGSRSPWRAPPLAWLERTWSVTHSTLPMWAKARNVRITYKLLLSPSPPSSGASGEAAAGGRTLIDDEVCSEPIESSSWVTAVMQPRSHWEILGWGESDLDGVHEKWVVTWFKASLFTPMGVDVYSDRKEGISEGLYGKIREALEGGLAGTEVAELCKGMFAVEIKY
ncbi:uncharacterized protein L3040_007932 [Drepanopeziza brunnea f. sp. 'multigermtubi']|uniref:uncharacterized protein n=1 Tax=Drepanopeziza brunnea f. sp. 'multigermtubi' TaxID=698441 RepID=UPI002395CEAD|nr:hypothetical protein L3040_007932 [Drepanopeziza brunnea f. sp. 'multigermtubi']